MIIEQHALWGEETTPVYPATYTAYLADKLPNTTTGPRPAVIICGGGGFTHIAAHEQEPVAFEFLNRGFQAFTLDYVTSSTGDVSYPNPQADLAKMVATVRLGFLPAVSSAPLWQRNGRAARSPGSRGRVRRIFVQMPPFCAIP